MMVQPLSRICLASRGLMSPLYLMQSYIECTHITSSTTTIIKEHIHVKSDYGKSRWGWHNCKMDILELEEESLSKWTNELVYMCVKLSYSCPSTGTDPRVLSPTKPQPNDKSMETRSIEWRTSLEGSRKRRVRCLNGHTTITITGVHISTVESVEWRSSLEGSREKKNAWAEINGGSKSG